MNVPLIAAAAPVAVYEALALVTRRVPTITATWRTLPRSGRIVGLCAWAWLGIHLYRNLTPLSVDDLDSLG